MLSTEALIGLPLSVVGAVINLFTVISRTVGLRTFIPRVRLS